MGVGLADGPGKGHGRVAHQGLFNYGGVYVVAAPDDKSDAEIEEIFISALEKMYPHFSRADVSAFKVSRVRQVFPLPTLDYSANVPSVETSIENLFIVNSAQITNGTLNVNETIQSAERFLSRKATQIGAKRIFETTDLHK